MAEETSISGAPPTSSKRWKKLMIFGGAILLLVLIPTIVFQTIWLTKIETKLDMLKEEKENISSRLDLVLSGEEGKY